MTGDDQTRPDASNAIETTARHTRRRFLKAGMATAGALAIGSAGVASGRQQICNSDYGTIDVASAFTLMDNRWGMKDAQQCIWLNEDGTYGYDFDASSTSGGINYPEVFVGTRPWGDSTGVPEFPIRRGDVNDLVMDVEADVSISGGEWDWAEEWWLCTEDPTVTPETHQYEIMLLLDWGGGHDHGAVEDQNAWTDRFGNTVSLWTVYNSGGTSATFYIFRIEGGHDGGKIDMAEIERYLTQNEGISEDLLISGLELGNEYWSGAVGSTTYRQFDVTVNGSTYTSGPGGSTSSTTTAADTTTQTTTSEQTTQTTTQQSGDAIAAIDPETTTPAVGEYVDFYITDLTGGDRWITDLAWTLGDGTTGTGWHAGHAYSAAGEYVVELTATANDGTTSVDTVTVTVGSGSSAEQTTTQTTEQTTTQTTEQTTTQTSTETTTQTTTSDGSSQPYGEISPSATTVSVGERVYFELSANESWLTGIEWDLGDGTTDTGSWFVAHTYDDPGSYTVTLRTQSGHTGEWTTDRVTIDVV